MPASSLRAFLATSIPSFPISTCVPSPFRALLTLCYASGRSSSNPSNLTRRPTVTKCDIT